MAKPKLSSRIGLGLALAALAITLPLKALAQTKEEISIEIRASEKPCPTSFNGRWPKPGDVVNLITISGENGIRPVYNGAEIVRIPTVDELPHDSPCNYSIVVRVDAEEATDLKQALFAHKKVTIMTGAPR
jgi:hypothetical protein